MVNKQNLFNSTGYNRIYNFLSIKSLFLNAQEWMVLCVHKYIYHSISKTKNALMQDHRIAQAMKTPLFRMFVYKSFKRCHVHIICANALAAGNGAFWMRLSHRTLPCVFVIYVRPVCVCIGNRVSAQKSVSGKHQSYIAMNKHTTYDLLAIEYSLSSCQPVN